MIKIYNAPKPTYTRWDWFNFIVIRAVFPFVLLWDLLKLGANKLLGRLVGSLVLPAQDMHRLSISNVGVFNEDDLTCEQHGVITHDGAHLDTFEVVHKSQESLSPTQQKYIISLVGNGMRYEDIIGEMKSDAKALNANVVGFNLRGVGQSTGRTKSKDDLITDGIAQVQRLLDKGVLPQNITLKGHSLGAGVASMVAEHFHKLGQPINVFSSRSFSSITNFVVGHIRLERDNRGLAVGHKENRFGIILGTLLKPLIKVLVSLVNWEIDAGSAFKSIPEANREYMVVRSSKVIRGDRIDDAVIPHYASVHAALTDERREKKAKMDVEIAKVDEAIKHADATGVHRLTEEKRALVVAREKIKGDRKMETGSRYIEGHNCGWTAVRNSSGQSAQTFFREFVQRTQDPHAPNPQCNQR